MSEAKEPLSLRSRAVCDLVKIPPSTLNYWVQVGLVKPSLRRPQGRRVEQYWSVEDVVIVRAVRQLRRAGASLQQVRKAAKRLAAWGSRMSNANLFWDGRDVVIQTTEGDLMSAVERPGQLAWFLASLPLGRWHQEATTEAQPVDLELIRRRDKERRKRQRADAEPFERLIEREDRAR